MKMEKPMKVKKPMKMEKRTITMTTGERLMLFDSGKTPWAAKLARDRRREALKEAKALKNQNIFEIRLVDDENGNPLRYEHRVMDGKKGSGRLALRTALSTVIPEPLKLPLLLEQRKLEEMDYAAAIPGVVHCFVDDFKDDNKQVFAFALYVSPEMTNGAELWDGDGGLVELQEFFTHPDFGGKKQRIFNFSAAVQTGHRTITRNKDSKKATPEATEMVHKSMMMGLKLLDFLPEEHRRREMLKRR